MKLTQAPWYSNSAVMRLFDLFADAGFDLYCVGGCVRNWVLGAAITDIDLSSNARPDDVKRICANAGIKVIPTGEAHGTLTLVLDGQAFEVTTFRKDIETDGRRAVIAFADCLHDDAMRRDFTLNALYADGAGQLHDPLGGIGDAKNSRIRFIGIAEDRITEDYLRIMRFFRFYAQYGGDDGIDADGLAACAALKDGLAQVSKERIGAEMIKLLSAPNPAPAMATMRQSGVMAAVLDGADDAALAPLVDFEPDDMPPDPYRRLAALMTQGADFTACLRLSKAGARKTRALRTAAQEYDTPLHMGYYLGLDMGRSAWVIRCALVQMAPNAANFAEIARGADAKCPVGAADLQGSFEGAALGDALRRVEKYWLDQNLAPNLAQLLSWINGQR